MSRIIRLSLAAVLPFALLQCGGEAGEPLTAASAPTVLSNLTTVVLAGLPRTTSAPALPVAGATTSAVPKKPLAATDCETVNPTTPVDADADSIALTKTATFNCTSLSNGGYTYTRSGSYTVTDLDDTVAGMMGGMRVEFDVPSYGTTTHSSGDVSNYSYSGFWNYVKEGSSLVSTSEFTGNHQYESAAYPWEINYGYTYTWNWTHTPDSLASPFLTGTESFSGTYTLNGQFVQEDSGGNHRQVTGTWSIRYYSDDIVFDSTCTKYYKSGSIFIDDGNGGVFEIRYACTSAALYYNGVASDIWTP